MNWFKKIFNRVNKQDPVFFVEIDRDSIKENEYTEGPVEILSGPCTITATLLFKNNTHLEKSGILNHSDINVTNLKLPELDAVLNNTNTSALVDVMTIMDFSDFKNYLLEHCIDLRNYTVSRPIMPIYTQNQPKYSYSYKPIQVQCSSCRKWFNLNKMMIDDDLDDCCPYCYTKDCCVIHYEQFKEDMV